MVASMYNLRTTYVQHTYNLRTTSYDLRTTYVQPTYNLRTTTLCTLVVGPVPCARICTALYSLDCFYDVCPWASQQQ